MVRFKNRYVLIEVETNNEEQIAKEVNGGILTNVQNHSYIIS